MSKQDGQPYQYQVKPCEMSSGCWFALETRVQDGRQLASHHPSWADAIAEVGRMRRMRGWQDVAIRAGMG